MSYRSNVFFFTCTCVLLYLDFGGVIMWIRRILWGKTVDPKDPGDPEGKLCGSEGSSGSQGSGGEIMWIRRNPWEKTVDPNDPPRIRGIPKENYVDSKDPVRG